MPTTDDMPTMTGYMIEGAAGRLIRSGLAIHDVQATAWAALGAITAARWERIELTQRRPGVFEIEGRNGTEGRSGVYLLTLGDFPAPLPGHEAAPPAHPTASAASGDEPHPEAPAPTGGEPDARPMDERSA